MVKAKKVSEVVDKTAKPTVKAVDKTAKTAVKAVDKAAKTNVKTAKETARVNAVDDIDTMFNELAAKQKKYKKKLELIEKEQLRIEKARIKEEQLAKAGVVVNNGPIINPDPPVHRYDSATGLPVYKAKLLKANEGGGTSLCPFDCNCCF